MNGLEILLGKPIFQSLGWTLLHFIWEGALIAIIYAAASVLLRRSSANLRYAAACSAMLMMLVAPAVTMFVVSRGQEAAFAAQPTASVLGTQPSSSTVRAEADQGSTRIATADNASSASSATLLKNWAIDRLPRTMPWLLALWFLGVFLLSVRFAGGLVTAQRLRRGETGSVLWQEKLRDLCIRLKVSRPVRLCESALVEVPTVIGWLKPVILIPVSAISGLSAEQLEALLAHELAHIRRYDYLVNLIQTTIETLLFYHPGVWWVSRQIRHEREHCCDDLAVAACGDVLTYARALTALEQMRAVTPQLAVAASGGSLVVRIQRLLRAGSPSSSGFQNWLAGFLALATVFGVLAVAETALLSRDAKAAVKDEFTMTLLPSLAIVPDLRVSSSPRVTEPSEPAQHVDQATEAGAPVDVPPTLDAARSDIPPVVQTADDKAPAEPRQSEANAQEASGQDFIAEMAAAGLTNLKIDDLISLKTHGVTAKFIREMSTALNRKLTADELVAMTVHGVSSQYAAQFKAMGLEADADQLVAFAIHGVTPQFINEMKAALPGAKLNPDTLVAFRIHGVTPVYVKQTRDLGFEHIDADDLIAFKIHGVTPEFIQIMRSVIRGKLTADDVAGLRIHGVNPEYIKGLEAIGYTNLNAEQLMGFRIHGVTPGFIAAIKQAGYPGVTADQLTELRINGVTPEFIQTVKSRGFTDVTVDQIVELRRLNIIPSSRKK